MKINRTQRRRARIEIIPLIDVTFLLLVFFIYLSLSMSIQRGIPLRLPAGATSEIDRLEAIDVSVDHRGRIFIDRERVPLEDLPEVVVAQVRARGVERVTLRGDRRVSYERVMEVLDGIRQAGVGKVALETRGEED